MFFGAPEVVVAATDYNDYDDYYCNEANNTEYCRIEDGYIPLIWTGSSCVGGGGDGRRRRNNRYTFCFR